LSDLARRIPHKTAKSKYSKSLTCARLAIRGWHIPSRNRAAVILLHPMASNRLGALDHALMFARHGSGILMIDLRAHGESGGTG
jgi:alpha-beta hydrolase superfamily lysophospholipase